MSGKEAPVAATKLMKTKDAPKKVITVDSKELFDKHVDEAGNKHVLVEFYAVWCGPCKLIGPRLEELANEYADKLVILKVDVDDHEELAEDYDISMMPTFVIIKNKQTLEQFVGSNSAKVESTLEKFCGKPTSNGNGNSKASKSSKVTAETSDRMKSVLAKLKKTEKPKPDGGAKE